MRSAWAIDERQVLVTWAQAWPGKLTLLTFAFLALTMTLSWQEALFIVAAMAFFAYWPQWRSLILFASTYIVAFIFPHGSIDDAIRGVAAHEGFAEVSTAALSYLALIGFSFIAWGLLAYARHHKQSVLAQRPFLPSSTPN